MSDWRSVIVVWAGIEPSQKNQDWHTARLADVCAKAVELDKYNQALTRKWNITQPCPHPDAPALTCEFVAVTHWNYFNADDLLPALGTFKWRYPEQVGVLWKGEEDATYRSAYLEEGD